jgi:hypothetical protein
VAAEAEPIACGLLRPSLTGTTRRGVHRLALDVCARHFGARRAASQRMDSAGWNQAIFIKLSLSAMQASMHALQDCAHILQTSLSSACAMHSSMHIWHVAIVASSIDTVTSRVMPCIRSMQFIIVLHIAAQFMHAGAHGVISMEHTMDACSHAEQASRQASMTDMSVVLMPALAMSLDIMSIIIEFTAHSFEFSQQRLLPPVRTLLSAARRVTGSPASMGRP